MITSPHTSHRFRNAVLASLLAAAALGALGYQATQGTAARAPAKKAAQAVTRPTTSPPRAVQPEPISPPTTTEFALNPAEENMPNEPKPLEAPAIETPDVIASMDIEFVRDEVKRMDEELERRRAVERLNGEEASPDERAELGALFQRSALFRHRLMEDEVESLSNTLAAYEKTHAARVAELTRGIPSR